MRIVYDRILDRHAIASIEPEHAAADFTLEFRPLEIDRNAFETLQMDRSDLTRIKRINRLGYLNRLFTCGQRPVDQRRERIRRCGIGTKAESECRAGKQEDNLALPLFFANMLHNYLPEAGATPCHLASLRVLYQNLCRRYFILRKFLLRYCAMGERGQGESRTNFIDVR